MTEFSVVVERDVRVPTRDGTSIAVDVYRPAIDGRAVVEPFPALYAVSPYQKDLAHLPPTPVFRWRETGNIDWWVQRGYVYVHGDTRGAGNSTCGEWRVLDTQEQEDLYDAIEWIGAQPWCTGKVGMTGESYYAVVQWLAAAQQPPHLACIAPYDGWVDPYRDLFYHGGIPLMGFTTWWLWDVRARRLLDQPGPHDDALMAYDFINDLLRHPTDDEFWQERSAHEKFASIQVPFYSMSNWTMVGIHLRANLLAFEELEGPKKLLVASGAIGGDSQRFYHSEELHEELLRWYDYWLKGIDTGVMDGPPVKLFIRGGEGFRDEAGWPVPGTDYRSLYLREGRVGAVASLNDGGLAWEPPDADEGSAGYTYPDPRWGGWPIFGPAVMDASGQPDPTATILTFSSAPLPDDVEVTGPIVCRLWLSLDQRDTDVYLKLVDLPPEGGRAQRVTRGWLRASHRALDPERSRPHRPFHTHRDPEPLVPGEVYALDIEVWPTSWVFKAGHRICLEVAPADSPFFDMPLNHHYGIRTGTDTFLHDAAHPSHLVLPVVPSGRSR